MTSLYAVLAIVAVACCLRGPRPGVAALAAVLPLSRTLPSLPVPLLNTQNLLVIAALCSFLAGARGGVQGRSVRFLGPLLLFLLLITLSLANTMLFFEPPTPAHAQGWATYSYSVLIAFKSLVCCLILLAIGSLSGSREEDRRAVLRGLLAGMAVEAGFICLEVLVKGPARATGHLYEGNTAGAYLSWACASALAIFLVLGRSRLEGLLALATSGASAAALVFTLSRGNWLACVAACATVGLLASRRFLIVLAAALALAPVWMPGRAMQRLASTFISAEDEPARFRLREQSDEAQALGRLQERLAGSMVEGEDVDRAARLDGSSQLRLFVWQAGLRMIGDYPLGVGFGVFPVYMYHYSEVVRYAAAHNTYLQLAAETGLAGLASFLLLLGCLLRASWIAWRRGADPIARALGLAGLGGALSMMVSACFYNFFFLIELNGQQWLVLGLAAQAARSRQRAAARVEPAADGGPVPLHRLVT